ncbi:MAG: hypothetical protein ABW328_03235 [Ilumatobacteraceae bacterium]
MSAPRPIDVAVVDWPADHRARTTARATGRPCLLVIDADIAPPTDCDRHEDWVRTTADPTEVAIRTQALSRHAPSGRQPILDRSAVMALPDLQLSLLGALDARPGRVTPRQRLDDVVDAHHRRTGELDRGAALRALSARLRGAGFHLVDVPGGVLLARSADDDVSA